MKQRLGQVALCQSQSDYDFNEKERGWLQTMDEEIGKDFDFLLPLHDRKTTLQIS